MWYVIQTPPTHGHLCLISHAPCMESLLTFTQHDLNYHRIVYRPGNTSMTFPGGARHPTLVPDNFTFITTVQGVSQLRPFLHTFHWTTTTSVGSAVGVVGGPFWIRAQTEKVIPLESFEAFSSAVESEELSFHVLEQPQYGHLSLQNATNRFAVMPASFSLQQVRERILWYSHQQQGPTPCSDQLLLKVVSPLRNLTGHLPILFQREDAAELSVQLSTPRQLWGLTEFTFSSRDLNASSRFCPQFVEFTVTRIPALGALRLRDHTHKTQQQLQVGSTFTAQDVRSGALSYSCLRSALQHNATNTDTFTVRASDPVSAWGGGSEDAVGEFQIELLPAPSAQLEVRFSTGHPLTWLPARRAYGYAFSARDIDLLNSTLQPREVVIQVEETLTRGRLEREGTVISFFTVKELQEGKILYTKNRLNVTQGFTESIQFGVYAHFASFSQRVALHSFLLEWALIGIEGNGTHTVREGQGTFQLVLRCVTCVCVCAQGWGRGGCIVWGILSECEAQSCCWGVVLNGWRQCSHLDPMTGPLLGLPVSTWREEQQWGESSCFPLAFKLPTGHQHSNCIIGLPVHSLWLLPKLHSTYEATLFSSSSSSPS